MGKSLLGIGLAALVATGIGAGSAYADNIFTKARKEITDYVAVHGKKTIDGGRLALASCNNGEYWGVIYKEPSSDGIKILVHSKSEDINYMENDFLVNVLGSIKSTRLETTPCIISTEEFVAKYKALTLEQEIPKKIDKWDFRIIKPKHLQGN